MKNISIKNWAFISSAIANILLISTIPFTGLGSTWTSIAQWLYLFFMLTSIILFVIGRKTEKQQTPIS